MLSRVLHSGVEANWARSSQEYLRSFGERYLNPFFSPGASFEIFTVFPLSEKKSRNISSYISTFHPKMWPILRPTLISRKLERVDKIQNDGLKKCQAVLDASPEKAGGTSRKTTRTRPFPGSNTPAKVLKETSIVSF